MMTSNQEVFFTCLLILVVLWMCFWDNVVGYAENRLSSQKGNKKDSEMPMPTPPVADNAAARASRERDYATKKRLRAERMLNVRLATGEEIYKMFKERWSAAGSHPERKPSYTRYTDHFSVYIGEELTVRVFLNRNPDPIVIAGEPSWLDGNEEMRFKTVHFGRIYCQEILAKRLYPAS